MVKAYDQATIAQRLTELPSWRLEDGKLRREFVFGNFVEAFGFMTRIAGIRAAWCGLSKSRSRTLPNFTSRIRHLSGNLDAGTPGRRLRRRRHARLARGLPRVRPRARVKGHPPRGLRSVPSAVSQSLPKSNTRVASGGGRAGTGRGHSVAIPR